MSRHWRSQGSWIGYVIGHTKHWPVLEWTGQILGYALAIRRVGIKPNVCLLTDSRTTCDE